MKKAKSILALLMAFVMLMSFAVTGSAANSDAIAEEKEANNSFKTATAFGFATKIKGILDESNDIDYYSFTANSAGLATVTIAHNLIEDANKDLAYFEITVYDGAEKEQLVFRSTGSEKETVSQSFAISQGATYFIKVEMGTIHSETLEYSVTASFDKGALVEKEPNNQAAVATPLELSKSGSAKIYYGNISSTGSDVDFYRVALAKNGVIYIYLYNGNIPGDFKATLYTHYETVDGVLIEEPITSVEINSNEEYKMSAAIGVYGKEYMLKVEGINGKTGDYRTRVFYQEVSDAEMEYNNKPNLYNSIPVGSSLRGTISHDTITSTDIDYYGFKATKDNVGYEISLSLADDKSPKTGSWYITVTEGKNAGVVAEANKIEVKAGETKVIKTGVLEAGRNYYIEVEAGSTHTAEIYRLSVKAIVPEEKPNPDEPTDFWAQLKAYFQIFWDNNFKNWVDDGVNFIGMLSNLIPSIIQGLPTLFTWLLSFLG
ncbi:MAG: hypothetical protein IKW12_01910 [Clostridia bacterium]|nr:hypothetical protein [Clostridia bacterium]